MLLLPSRSSGSQFSSPTPTHTPSSWGTDFPSHVQLRSSLCPTEQPLRNQTPSPELQLPPPLRAAPELARNSFFQLPQTELALGGQTAPRAVFPPPRVRRKDNSPNPRELAELILCRGSVVLSHPHPPWHFGFPVSGRAFPAAACPWHGGKSGCLSPTGQNLSPPCSCPGVTRGEAGPAVKHSSCCPRRAGSGETLGESGSTDSTKK